MLQSTRLFVLAAIGLPSTTGVLGFSLRRNVNVNVNVDENVNDAADDAAIAASAEFRAFADELS